MTKAILYKDDMIICFGDSDYMACIMNKDGEIESETFKTIPEAKIFIDRGRK